MATYACPTGFALRGDTTRICGGDGSSPSGVWSGLSPSCTGKQKIKDAALHMYIYIHLYNTLNTCTQLLDSEALYIQWFSQVVAKGAIALPFSGSLLHSHSLACCTVPCMLTRLKKC